MRKNKKILLVSLIVACNVLSYSSRLPKEKIDITVNVPDTCTRKKCHTETVKGKCIINPNPNPDDPDEFTHCDSDTTKERCEKIDYALKNLHKAYIVKAKLPYNSEMKKVK